MFDVSKSHCPGGVITLGLSALSNAFRSCTISTQRMSLFMLSCSSVRFVSAASAHDLPIKVREVVNRILDKTEPLAELPTIGKMVQEVNDDL